MSHPAVPIVISVLAVAAAGGAWIKTTQAQLQSHQIAAESASRHEAHAKETERFILSGKSQQVEDRKYLETLIDRLKNLESRLAAAEKRPDPVTGNDADTDTGASRAMPGNADSI